MASTHSFENENRHTPSNDAQTTRFSAADIPHYPSRDQSQDHASEWYPALHHLPASHSSMLDAHTTLSSHTSPANDVPAAVFNPNIVSPGDAPSNGAPACPPQFPAASIHPSDGHFRHAVPSVPHPAFTQTPYSSAAVLPAQQHPLNAYSSLAHAAHAASSQSATSPSAPPAFTIAALYAAPQPASDANLSYTHLQHGNPPHLSFVVGQNANVPVATPSNGVYLLPFYLMLQSPSLGTNLQPVIPVAVPVMLNPATAQTHAALHRTVDRSGPQSDLHDPRLFNVAPNDGLPTDYSARPTAGSGSFSIPDDPQNHPMSGSANSTGLSASEASQRRTIPSTRSNYSASIANSRGCSNGGGPSRTASTRRAEARNRSLSQPLQKKAPLPDIPNLELFIEDLKDEYCILATTSYCPFMEAKDKKILCNIALLPVLYKHQFSMHFLALHVLITHSAILGDVELTPALFKPVAKVWDNMRTEFIRNKLVHVCDQTFRITLPSRDRPHHKPSISEVISRVKYLKGPHLGFLCVGLDENVSNVHASAIWASNLVAGLHGGCQPESILGYAGRIPVLFPERPWSQFPREIWWGLHGCFQCSNVYDGTYP